MKRIHTLLLLNPSYCKWGSERLAIKTGLAVSTINRFKKTELFKQIKSNYLRGL
jgi:hypothetical protein